MNKYSGHFGEPGLAAATIAHLSRVDLARTRHYIVAEHFGMSEHAFRSSLWREGYRYSDLLEQERARRLKIVLSHMKRPLYSEDLKLAFGYWRDNNAIKKLVQMTGETMTEQNRRRWGRPCASEVEKRRYPPMRWGCT